MDSREWYALQVYTGKERWVTAALEERGHDPLLLLYTVVSKWSDRRMQIDRAVFPGYVFCDLDLHRRAAILGIPGVLRVVGAGRTPVPLEHTEISSLLRIAEAGYCVAPAPYFKAGERVIIRGGALDGVTGRVVNFRKGLRVVVSISLLQRAVALEVDAARLERVSAGSDDPEDCEAPGNELLSASGIDQLMPVKRYKAQ